MTKSTSRTSTTMADIVLVKNARSVWWPAAVDAAIDGQTTAVKFIGASKSPRKTQRNPNVMHDETARLTLTETSSVKFDDPELNAAMKKAVKMAHPFPKVVLAPLGHDGKNYLPSEPLIKLHRVKTEDCDGRSRSNDWKDNFLESLVSDAEEKEEPKETKKKRFTIRIKGRYNEDEDGDDFASDDEEKKDTLKRPAKKAKVKKEDEPISEYEAARLKNIAERAAMFEALKSEFTKFKSSIIPAAGPKRGGGGGPMRRIIHTKRDPYPTRSRRGSGGSSHASSSYAGSEISTPHKFMLYEERQGQDGEEVEDMEGRYHPKRWLMDPNDDFLKAEDVTPAMLENVATRVSDKKYSQVNGTTCHQCRQKTVDTKTICRSGHCAGGRGLFCGVCLPNRYGQDVKEALLDPDWSCPVCLGVCNCSICRNRLGKGATGPITYLAQAKGFSCVKDYLEALAKGKTNTKCYDDEE